MSAAESEEFFQAEDLAARERTAARFRLLWEARRFLASVVVCGLVVSGLIAFRLAKRYQAVVSLMPPAQAESHSAGMLGALAGAAGVAGVAGAAAALSPLTENTFAVRTTGDLFVGILQSSTVQDALIRKFELQKVYSTAYLESARLALAKHTEVSLERRSGILTIKVTDVSPQRAAAMAQEYVNELNWVVNNLSTSSARRQRLFLEERLKQVKDDLRGAEQQFSEFASKKGTVDIQGQGRAMFEAAARLQGQLIAAESELGGLRQIYTPDNIRVRSLEAQVAELRRQLHKMGGQQNNPSQQDNPNRPSEELYPSIRQLPLVGVNYADLQRQVKVQEAVFETLTREYENAKVQEAKEIPTVQILDPPMAPQRRSFPPRLRIMLLGTTLAFVLGMVWVFVKAMWQKADPQDPRKVLALEVFQTTRAFAANVPKRGKVTPPGGPFDEIGRVRLAEPGKH
jgi:capsule polysaccharide export protein KpsE/RkpR